MERKRKENKKKSYFYFGISTVNIAKIDHGCSGDKKSPRRRRMINRKKEEEMDEENNQ